MTWADSGIHNARRFPGVGVVSRLVLSYENPSSVFDLDWCQIGLDISPIQVTPYLDRYHEAILWSSRYEPQYHDQYHCWS
jgi:hypothetical protein